MFQLADRRLLSADVGQSRIGLESSIPRNLIHHIHELFPLPEPIQIFEETIKSRAQESLDAISSVRRQQYIRQSPKGVICRQRFHIEDIQRCASNLGRLESMH